MFFELVSISFAIVLDYGYEYMTKEPVLKILHSKLNSNHNMYFMFLVLILLPWG